MTVYGYYRNVPKPKDTEKELMEKAKSNFDKFAIPFLKEVEGMTGELVASIICTGIRLGVMSNGGISSKTRLFVRKFLKDKLETNGEDPLALYIELPIEESCFQLVEKIYMTNFQLGMVYFDFVQCFGATVTKFEKTDVYKRIKEIEDNVKAQNYQRNDPKLVDSEEILMAKAEECSNFISSVCLNEIEEMTEEILAALFFNGIRLGVMADKEISPRERKFVKKFIKNNFEIKGIDPIATFIELPIEEHCFKLVEDAYMTSIRLGEAYFDFIKCFGYVDTHFTKTSVYKRIKKIEESY